jgi:hypothetical protein
MFKIVEYGSGIKKKFTLSPYTCKEEREIVISFTINEENLTDKNLRMTLEHLKGCIKEDFEVDELNIDEVKFLLLSLRSLAIGEECNIKNQCPHCKQAFDYVIDIGGMLNDSNCNEEYVKLDNFVFYFRETFNDNEMNDFISKIIFQEHSIINREEINKIIDDLDFDDYDKLEEFVKNSRTIFNFKFIGKCQYCEEPISFNFGGVDFILKSLSEDSFVSFYKTISDIVYFGKYSKLDVDSMFPFERNILTGMLQKTIEELKNAKPA